MKAAILDSGLPIAATFAFRTTRRIGDIVRNRGDEGVIYKINCKGCPAEYVGQIGRKLTTRIREHRQGINHGNPNSKVARHAKETGHSIDFENTRVLCGEQNWFPKNGEESCIHPDTEADYEWQWWIQPKAQLLNIRKKSSSGQVD